MNEHFQPADEPVEFILRKNVTSQDSVDNILVNEALTLPRVDFKRICICASGPSLADHVEDIRARQAAGWHVASMNGSHNFLIERGIVPDYMFMVDARPINLPFLALANDTTTYIIASQCQPEIFAALEGRKVQVWSMFHDEAGLRAIQATKKDGAAGQPSANFVGSMNVGQSCLTPIWALGYKVWHLFGYDGSMRGEAKHAFAQSQNDGEAVQDFFWPMPGGKQIEGVTKRYIATPTMAHAAQNLPDRVTYFRRLGIEIELYGQGLAQDMVAALAPAEGAVTAPGREQVFPDLPSARPRKKAVERLQVVTFKWAGHIPYFAQDVNVWGSMVSRHLKMPHELVLVTDDGAGVDGAIRQIPLWRDQFEHGRDWHRVKLFAEEMADTIGPRFVIMDLDTVICGGLDPLFDNSHPYMAWQDPIRDQYCTALQIMDAGAFPHVWERFDPEFAMRLRRQGTFGGYDQAWISYALPGQPRWTADDGVLSFRGDVLKGRDLESYGADEVALPAGARVVNFHGRYNPRDALVQANCPWVRDYWRTSQIVSQQDQDEARKYRNIWTFDNYRKHSPGATYVFDFLYAAALRIQLGDRIVDLGCGTGRASEEFARLGFRVTAVDFADNAFEGGRGVDFVLGNLWSLPEGVEGDWGYCCDVMEHLPPERVSQALAGFAKRMTKGCFFSICFVPDESGLAIGETLHLTVRPKEWWLARLGEYFTTVEFIPIEGSERDGLFLCRKH